MSEHEIFTEEWCNAAGVLFTFKSCWEHVGSRDKQPFFKGVKNLMTTTIPIMMINDCSEWPWQLSIAGHQFYKTSLPFPAVPQGNGARIGGRVESLKPKPITNFKMQKEKEKKPWVDFTEEGTIFIQESRGPLTCVNGSPLSKGNLGIDFIKEGKLRYGGVLGGLLRSVIRPILLRATNFL